VVLASLVLAGCTDYGVDGNPCIDSVTELPLGSSPPEYEDLADLLTGTYAFEDQRWPLLTFAVHAEDLEGQRTDMRAKCDLEPVIRASGDGQASLSPEQGTNGQSSVFFADIHARVGAIYSTTAVNQNDLTPFAVWIDATARAFDSEIGALRWFEIELRWPDEEAAVKGYFNPVGQTGGTPQQIGSVIPEFTTSFTRID
jgi:hypothetical protein